VALPRLAIQHHGADAHDAAHDETHLWPPEGRSHAPQHAVVPHPPTSHRRAPPPIALQVPSPGVAHQARCRHP
jgi:hypothetical protein